MMYSECGNWPLVRLILDLTDALLDQFLIKSIIIQNLKISGQADGQPDLQSCNSQNEKVLPTYQQAMLGKCHRI